MATQKYDYSILRGTVDKSLSCVINEAAKEGYEVVSIDFKEDAALVRKDLNDLPDSRMIVNGQKFIKNFIEGNESLNEEAKQFLAEQAVAKIGPWSIQGHVTGVFQETGRITVCHRNGESYYYL